MSMELILFLAALTIFLLVKIRKVILGARKDVETTEEGKPKETLINRLNLLQKWSLKRIVWWAFGVFLGFELIFLMFDVPNFSLIRKLVDIAYRNDPKYIYNRMLESREKQEKQKAAEELRKTANLLEAERIMLKSGGGKPQRRLSRALLENVHINVKSEGYSTSARIDYFGDEKLVISCVLSDKGFLGKIRAMWSEEEQLYMGTWTDPYKTGQIKLKPFTDPFGSVYRFDGIHKNDGDGKWMELAITHRGDYEGSKSNAVVSCR